MLDPNICIALNNQNPQALAEFYSKSSQCYISTKVGIFTDANGDKLAFGSSCNEPISDWEANIESFYVFCAWEAG